MISKYQQKVIEALEKGFVIQGNYYIDTGWQYRGKYSCDCINKRTINTLIRKGFIEKELSEGNKDVCRIVLINQN